MATIEITQKVKLPSTSPKVEWEGFGLMSGNISLPRYSFQTTVRLKDCGNYVGGRIGLVQYLLDFHQLVRHKSDSRQYTSYKTQQSFPVLDKTNEGPEAPYYSNDGCKTVQDPNGEYVLSLSDMPNFAVDKRLQIDQDAILTAVHAKWLFRVGILLRNSAQNPNLDLWGPEPWSWFMFLRAIFTIEIGKDKYRRPKFDGSQSNGFYGGTTLPETCPKKMDGPYPPENEESSAPAQESDVMFETRLNNLGLVYQGEWPPASG